jgi:RNA polymerase sigma-70 factor (ECF subfamily)
LLKIRSVNTMFKVSQQIVNQLINGDESSFKAIFNFFYPRLYHFVHTYIPDDDLAENIVQDTFLTLWNKRRDLKPNSNLNAWLYTVARNHCLKKLRDDKSKEVLFLFNLNELELEMNTEALASLDTSEFTFHEIERIIAHTLDTLPPQCRKIFELSRYENKKNKEIAEEMAISIKAVENQITKALKIFKDALKDYLPLILHLFICWKLFLFF